MTDGRNTLVQILRRRQTAAALVELMRRQAQGQCFELLIRVDSGGPLLPAAILAGSALHSVSVEDWQGVLSRLGSRNPGFFEGSLSITEYRGLPLIWQVPSRSIQVRSFVDLQESLAVLMPVAVEYRKSMEDLLRGLERARTIEEWQILSNARLHLVQLVMSEVLEWVRSGIRLADSSPTLLISGSSSWGPGLVSDIDFIPLWPSATGHEPAGCEALERLATGLNACGIKADNIIVLASGHRFMALSLTDAPSELAAIESQLRLASGLIAAQGGLVVGNKELAEAFGRRLELREWRPSLRRWRRRWIGWWAELQRTIDQAPAMPYPLLVPLYLRQVTVLREMLQYLPQHDSYHRAMDGVARLRSELAWLRDIVLLSVTRRSSEPELEYLSRVAEKVGLASAAALEDHWRRLLNELGGQANTVFEAAGLSFWRGRLGRAIAKRPFLHPILRRDMPLARYYATAVDLRDQISCRPLRLPF